MVEETESMQGAERSSFVLAFESTHAAMAAQVAFKNEGVSFALIPTPREISAGCGMSLKFKAPSDGEARALARRALPSDVRACAKLYEAQGYTELS